MQIGFQNAIYFKEREAQNIVYFICSNASCWIFFTLYAFKIKDKTEGFPLNFTFLYDKLTKIRLNFNLLQNCNQF